MEETTSPDPVRGDPAAGAGAIGAALALVGAALSWPGDPVLPVAGLGSPVGAFLAVVALVAFLGRRWDLLDREIGAPLAGVAGAGLAVLASVRLVAPAIDGSVLVGPGLGITMLAGILAVGFAAADYRGASAEDLTSMGVGVLLAIGLTIAGFVAQILMTIPIGIYQQQYVTDTFGEVVVQVLSPVALLGFVFVAVVFLLATDRGLDWIDVSVPTLKDLGFAAAGLVGLIAVQMVVALTIYYVGIPSSENTIVDIAETAVDEGYTWLILLLVPLQLVVVGPAEELLFRGVIQKYLYGPFSRGGAIVVAALIFASAHVFAYWDQNPAALFVSLVAVFLLSLVLGTVYERTDNLVVPALVHGSFNAILVVMMYVAVVAEELPDSATLLLP